MGLVAFTGVSKMVKVIVSRKRSVLTVLSIAVSVFVFAALMSLPALVDQIMRDRANGVALNILGWVATLAMFAAAIALVVTWRNS